MISFIVPAYNEERLLGATLDALHAAGHAAGELYAGHAAGELYELVVVDDASTDRTAIIAQRHGALLVSVAHRQIAATRNSGARKANGDLFIFVDADTIVNEAVVRSAVEALRGGAAGGGAAVEFDGAVPLYARLLMPVLVRLFRAARLAAGCFLFCTRSAFVAVGGFDVTSGRKLRTHSVGEVLMVVGRLALRGPRAVKRRQGMELWYTERREDPQQDA